MSETSAAAVTQLDCPSCARANAPDANFCAGCGFQFRGARLLDESIHGGAADPLLGQVIAERYRIEELLGRGGMGVVYRVEHVRMRKLMAMKLLHGALARERDVVRRFKREAEAASKLDHQNTVQVFDFGQSDGMTYLVMEYLSGRDLGQVIREEGTLDFTRACRIGVQICASVQQAHERGIVHRDLKPENIMMMDTGERVDYLKVLDFGLAKLREEEAGERSITHAGSILGTPYYMAPEHIRGDDVDARADIYALGALIYKAITGVPPFRAATSVGVLTMHLTEDVPPPSTRNPELPEAADQIVLRAMAKERTERFQSMNAFRRAMDDFLESTAEGGVYTTGDYWSNSELVESSPSGRQRKAATRFDVDGFERQIRRRSIFLNFLGMLLLVAVGALVYTAWWHRPIDHDPLEVEPNDQLDEATPLPPGAVYSGYIGRRSSQGRSDADIFRLDNPNGYRRVIRVEVTRVPNIDLVIELYRSGIATPVITSNATQVGGDEIIANFVIEGPTYFLRVRENWEGSRHPTENVSDAYTVRWDVVPSRDGVESEINDSPELSERIGVGESILGYIGWSSDRDIYCFADPVRTAPLRVELDGISTLDLQIEVMDRTTGRVTEVNAGGIGDSEQTVVSPDDNVCFEVSARRLKVGARNAPDEPYEFRLLAQDVAESEP